MSLFKMTALTCPACETTSDFQAAGSVNADRRPDLREAILDDSFQSVACPNCGEVMRLQPVVNYLDVELGLWLAAYPAAQVAEFRTLEGEVKTLFDASYGAEASDSAQSVGNDLRPRLTFGWPATREKLFLQQQGLDDVTVEMLKLDLLRRLPQVPLRPGVDLRLINVSEAGFEFAWIESDTEDVVQQFQANRALLDEIEANADAWADLRQSLTDGMFVDMQKLYMGDQEEVA